MDGLTAGELLDRMASSYTDRYRRRAAARYGDPDYPIRALRTAKPMPDLDKPSPVVD